jgi:predicted O-methyltransferase YrrM
MNNIKHKYNKLCKTKSDINEHLPTLFKYASNCESVIECGVRRCVSSWALAYGLMSNGKSNNKLILNDIEECDVKEFLSETNNSKLSVILEWCSNIDLILNEEVDMVFIDTWHVYGQLKRELAKFKHTKKYIIMHDTQTDGIYGESVRNKHDVLEKMNLFGMTEYEVTTGLQPAIDEFLGDNPNWNVCEVFTNNNGLTVLKKSDESI